MSETKDWGKEAFVSFFFLGKAPVAPGTFGSFGKSTGGSDPGTDYAVTAAPLNTFYGENGAAKIYGAQKGASEEEIAFLDKGLESFASVLKSTFDVDVQDIDGAGAAGGVGGGAVVFLNAELTSGVDLVMELANFDEVLEGADWVITGEGQLDGQTFSGKTINGVVQSAKKHHVPIAAFCGSIDVSIEEMKRMGLDYAVSILNQIGSLDDAKAKTVGNLELASYNFANLLKLSKG